VFADELYAAKADTNVRTNVNAPRQHTNYHRFTSGVSSVKAERSGVHYCAPLRYANRAGNNGATTGVDENIDRFTSRVNGLRSAALNTLVVVNAHAFGFMTSMLTGV